MFLIYTAIFGRTWKMIVLNFGIAWAMVSTLSRAKTIAQLKDHKIPFANWPSMGSSGTISSFAFYDAIEWPKWIDRIMMAVPLLIILASGPLNFRLYAWKIYLISKVKTLLWLCPGPSIKVIFDELRQSV